MMSPVERRRGMRASPSSWTLQLAGHSAGARTLVGAGTGRGGTPVVRQARRKGMSVPQCPPLKPALTGTASGSYSSAALRDSWQLTACCASVR